MAVDTPEPRMTNSDGGAAVMLGGGVKARPLGKFGSGI